MLDIYIKNAITKLEEQQASIDESPSDGGRRLAYACCIVYLKYYNNKINLDIGQVEIILKACLIRPNKSGNVCPDYDQLRTVYFVDEWWCRSVLAVIL